MRFRRRHRLLVLRGQVPRQSEALRRQLLRGAEQRGGADRGERGQVLAEGDDPLVPGDARGARLRGEKYVQGSAKRWALGCVIPASWLPLAATGEFTHPRTHLLADPCIHHNQLWAQKNYLRACVAYFEKDGFTVD